MITWCKMKISLITKPRKYKDVYYLRFYKGYSKIDNKIKHNVKFENLGIWLYKNPVKKNHKAHNIEQTELANEILKVRDAGIIQGRFDIKTLSTGKADYLQFFTRLTKERKESSGNYGNWDSTLKHLFKFTGGTLKFKNVNDSFAEGFLQYLDSTELSTNSKISYFNKFKASAKIAFEKKLLSESIQTKTNHKQEEDNRAFLTKSEINTLVKTPCKLTVLKDAFLFGCHCGLRYGDIAKLTWKDIDVIDSDTYRMKFKALKTGKTAWHPLSKPAIDILKAQEKIKGDYRIFYKLRPRLESWSNLRLAQWMLAAKISKDGITFHSSRHSFAVAYLLAGGNVYTLKNLMQHSSLKTTEVYLKFVDEMQDEAITKLNEYWS